MTATMRPETIQGIREELGATDKDHAHIVRVGPGQNAAAVVLRARVKSDDNNGTVRVYVDTPERSVESPTVSEM